MKKIAVIFPGQGSQYSGMGRKLLDRWGPSAEVFELADRIIGRSLSKLCLSGSRDQLDDTVNAQPAIFAVNLLYWRWLTANINGLRPDFAAGHSLGEYSALTAAEVIDETKALRLVRERSELMKLAAGETQGGMTAVIGLNADQVRAALNRLDQEVQIANFNSPAQIVISGGLSDLEAAETSLRQAGARKLIRLPVSGAFHSRLMQKAEAEFAEFVQGIEFNPAKIPVVSNYLAEPVTSPADIKSALAKQITGSVKWEQSVKWLLANDVDTFIEAGPGQVLKGLISRIAPEATVFSLDGYENIDDFKYEWDKR